MKFYNMKKNYKFTPNLSPEELEALKQLRSDNSLVIKKADKGSTVVIINRDDYIAKVERQLNNSKFYKKNLMTIQKNSFKRI